MCTVTWMRQPDGYLLLCNRDEHNSRRPALGPSIQELLGVKYVAPVDGDHGGSWIGVNQHGLSLCLLNRYGETPPDETGDYISRGLLLVGLLDCSKVKLVTTRINEFNLNRFRPFTLLALSREKNSVLIEWTGSTFAVNPDAEDLVPLSSTSLVEPNIAVERRRQFQALISEVGRTSESLERFHRSHLPSRGAYSVCMHREGAATVSLSKVTVAGDEVLFAYESGSPCENGVVENVRLQ